MAFQRDGANNVIAFAEAEDVRNLDQRLFEANVIELPPRCRLVQNGIPTQVQ